MQPAYEPRRQRGMPGTSATPMHTLRLTAHSHRRVQIDERVRLGPPPAKAPTIPVEIVPIRCRGGPTGSCRFLEMPVEAWGC